VQNEQCFAANILHLIKRNQRNWSCFKQTLQKSSSKPSANYTIDQCEIQLHWCFNADNRAEARAHIVQTLNSAMQLYFYIKFPVCQEIVQDKHENFIKQVSVITN